MRQLQGKRRCQLYNNTIYIETQSARNIAYKHFILSPMKLTNLHFPRATERLYLIARYAQMVQDSWQHLTSKATFSQPKQFRNRYSYILNNLLTHKFLRCFKPFLSSFAKYKRIFDTKLLLKRVFQCNTSYLQINFSMTPHTASHGPNCTEVSVVLYQLIVSHMIVLEVMCIWVRTQNFRTMSQD
ncbi:Hypothetical_protein [Hexamita inflata]|uniref:Hypothetical_protein n=1 Tax=Hexamita inflata TaxID=28002 RepID=A0ABP1HLU5_9EUKA